jgi:Ni/Fe-hydrogenase subunit HybB-like protein
MKKLKEFIGPLTFWKSVFFVIFALCVYGILYRLWYGLGASTNLTDVWPWGIWVSFNIQSGIALAAGGFTIAAAVYIFNIKRFKPIIRVAILLAFLGYIQAVTALIIEIGQPHRIWHPIVMWNPRSVLFEVAWCVILYNTVLFLEFAPAIFEKLRQKKIVKILKTITIPVVILGVILSTLHQSSLGSLFLIIPHKLHELWYTPWLPWLYYLSAIGGGLAMLIFASFLTKRSFNKGFDKDILVSLSRTLAAVLLVYLIMKFQDLGRLGALGYAFDFSFESMLFQTEILVGVLVPMVLLFFHKIRMNERALFWLSFMVIIGVVLNRHNVAITGIQANLVETYFPSFVEIVTSFGIVAIAVAAFGLASKYLPVFTSYEGEPKALVDEDREIDEGRAGAASDSGIPTEPIRIT